METKIKWNEGDGYITATYDGSGSGSASISSDVNEGVDREQTIKVETTDKSVSASLVVTQEGLREVFNASDGDFVLADGGTFNVLKGEEGGNEITFYLDDNVEIHEMKGMSDMTWAEWINTEYAYKEGWLSNFRIYKLSSENIIQCYHEAAYYDMSVWKEANQIHYVQAEDKIEDGKTYYLY